MGKKLDPKEFICGWGAGVINIMVTFPLHKAMFRQMLYGISTKKAIEQLKKEGFSLLYRGVLPPLCQKSISVSIMFGSYDYYAKKIVTNVPHINYQIAKSSSAGLAGLNEAVFLIPFERMQTLLQDKHYNSQFKNTGHIVGHIFKHHGFLEFYRGFIPVVMRNGTSNILFFAAREKAQKTLPKQNTIFRKYLVDFISGGLIGASLSTLFYPVNVVKTRMQSKLGGEFQSARNVLKIIYIERGHRIRSMFRGVHLNYTRSLLSWGIINASYELIKQLYDMGIHKTNT